MTHHQHRRLHHPTTARSLFLAAALIGGLVACGGSDDSGGASQADAPAGESPGDTSSGDASSGGSANGAALVSTGPITWNELQYPGVAIESGPDVGSAPAPTECPLLSVASFEAAMTASTPERPTLSEASTTECRWSGGFSSFRVTVENAADVPVDDHSGRGYNLDVEPVVVPQDGPGSSAVLLVDTAFADNAFNDDEGLTYGYFFVLEGQAVTLRMSAVFINDESWRPMADEVAAAITAGTAGLAAPAIDTSGGDAPAPVAPAPCTYFTIDEAASILGVSPASTAVSVQPLGQTKLCAWEAGSGSVMYVSGNLGTYTFEEFPEFNLGAEDISAAVGAPAYLRSGDTAIGFIEVTADLSGTETVLTYNVEVSGTRDVVDAVAVLTNLMGRVQPPE